MGVIGSLKQGVGGQGVWRLQLEDCGQTFSDVESCEEDGLDHGASQ